MSKIYRVISREVMYGYPKHSQRMIPGYILEDGVVLLDSERDEVGAYKGGAGMEGIYLQTGRRYSPIFEQNTVVAFAEIEGS